MNDGTMLSVFSSEMNDTFAMPRASPANAFIVKESEPSLADPPPASPESCRRDNRRQVSEESDSIFKTMAEALQPIIQPIEAAKAQFLRKMGAECYGPRMLRPLQPKIENLKCKLGLIDDRFMPTPPCDFEKCGMTPKLQEMEITRDMGFADPEALVEGQINSRGDCFNDIEPIAFGIRVQAMILKDVDCADIRYQQMCQDTMYENRIIWEEDCSSTG